MAHGLVVHACDRTFDVVLTDLLLQRLVEEPASPGQGTEFDSWIHMAMRVPSDVYNGHF